MLEYTALVISLELFIDPWSQTFITLIGGIGLLVIFFAFFYLHDAFSRKNFFPTILLFAASMLGIVTFDNLLMVFVCWELTSILSFFLISFYPENPKARKGATHAALITGAGGLSLLLAILMIQNITGSFSIRYLLDNIAMVSQHEWAPIIAVLILLGGMTKSALFPFSFWLPGAMTAPTPVSSYLHSATMVKAGIFLFYRFNPVFAQVPIWSQMLLFFGAVTFIAGSVRSFFEDDLKSILAYTTVASLGLMSFLIGWGTPEALVAVTAFLIAHALYKCALFQYAGIMDHQLHIRLLSSLGGLKNKLPQLFKLAALLAFIGIGFIPSYAFLAKEKILLSLNGNFLLLALMFLGFSFMGAAILRVTLAPFIGVLPAGLQGGDPKFGIVFSPWVLGIVSLLLVFASGQAQDLWHGFNVEIVLSLVSVACAILLFIFSKPLLQKLTFQKIQGAQIFDGLLQWHFSKTLKLTHVIQSGSLRTYILFVLVSAFSFMVWQWPNQVKIHWDFEMSAFQSVIAILALIKIFSLVWILRSQNALSSILGLGLIGYVVALYFALYGAPDLAMTQFAIETLSVFLFVFVLKDIPILKEKVSASAFSLDVAISVFAGFIVFAVAMIAVQTQAPSRLREYFGQTSLLEAHGHNVVNVILVDFRGFDTMGEIAVLGLAALGVVALIKMSKKEQGE